MAIRTLSIDQVLELLSKTPPRIAALTTGLTAAQLRSRPTREDWSANDVLAHLRACADGWGGCIETIITEDLPTIRAVNPRTWIKQTDYLELAFQPSLRAFVIQRNELLTILETLPHESWSRAARVTGAGAVLERTVLTFARALARHEQPHLKQIQRIVATIQTLHHSIALEA